MLNEHRLPPINGQPPAFVVMILHGLGDRGNGGLLEIGRLWQRVLPEAEFLCPDAPFAFDMASPDFGGRQWFSLREFTPESMMAGVAQATPFLNDYIDHVLATRRLTADRLALVGFSQGSMMSLSVAPRRKDQLGCVIGYSGSLVDGATLPAEKQSSPPVLLVHGTADDVVPYGMMGAAERGLRAAGLSVATLTCPNTGHTIDDQGLQAGLRFLQTHMAKSR